MGIYTDDHIILGVRVLIEKPQSSHNFFVEYEFSGDKWKENALEVLPYYLGKTGVKIQTLHSFSTSHNVQTGQEITPGNIWLDNQLFKITDLK
jgi:hypothetical protein